MNKQTNGNKLIQTEDRMAVIRRWAVWRDEKIDERD